MKQKNKRETGRRLACVSLILAESTMSRSHYWLAMIRLHLLLADGNFSHLQLTLANKELGGLAFLESHLSCTRW